MSPRLSVVVVAYRMSRPLLRTIGSLASDYCGVPEGEYEVVVVENESDDPFRGPTSSNVRHIVRHDDSGSPVAACNEGLKVARGGHVAVMIDGARMVTPGVVGKFLRIIDSFHDPLVGVPGYHIGKKLHRAQADTESVVQEEQSALTGIGWPENGYGLFDISVLSGSCRAGYLQAMSESNCLMMSADRWSELGGFDEAFLCRGGGLVNLDVYRRAVLAHPGSFLVLPGEGTFHQYHGGVTTGDASVDRESLIAEMQQEYRDLRGADYQPPRRRPMLFGAVAPQAMAVFRHSVHHLGLEEVTP